VKELEARWKGVDWSWNTHELAEVWYMNDKLEYALLFSSKQEAVRSYLVA
jgi:hypothetical protein